MKFHDTVVIGLLYAVSWTSATPTLMAATASAVHADVVLTQAQQQQVTTVKVGQIINVQDSPEFAWVVSYSPSVLRALTPPEKMSKPGPGGWVFSVIAPGSTEIVLESVAPPCPGGTACPPNFVRFVFPIVAVLEG